jgi:hypothetical protein
MIIFKNVDGEDLTLFEMDIFDEFFKRGLRRSVKFTARVVGLGTEI